MMIDGKIIVYLGQRWSSFDGEYNDKLIGEHCGNLVIERPDKTNYFVSGQKYSVCTHMTSDEYDKKNKDFIKFLKEKERKMKNGTPIVLGDSPLSIGIKPAFTKDTITGELIPTILFHNINGIENQENFKAGDVIISGNYPIIATIVVKDIKSLQPLLDAITTIVTYDEQMAYIKETTEAAKLVAGEQLEFAFMNDCSQDTF